MSRFGARKTKTEEQMPVIDDPATPTEPIEIDLGDPIDGDVTVELQPEPKVEPKVEVKTEPEPEGSPLQKALDAQRRAEELQQRAMRERDEAVRRAQEREQELGRERIERADAEYNSVLTAIAAEQSAADKAEMDYAQAMAAQDYAAVAKAQRVLSAASARLDRLEDGKRAFDTRREAAEEPVVATTRVAPVQPQSFEARVAQFPPDAREWLRKHPDYIEDNAKALKASGVHGYLVDTMGVEPFSRTYFDQLETHLGLKTAAEPAVTTTQEQPQKRSMPMSAPVSRAAPSTSGQRNEGKMTLTAEEREVARNSFSASDMTNAQKEYLYAQNKSKLRKMRANGEYRQTTEQNG